MSNDWQNDFPSDSWLATKAFRWTVITVVCISIGVSILMALKPTWLRMERDAVKASHQYVESKETMLLTWLDEYREVEVQLEQAKLIQPEPSPGLIMGMEMQKKTLGDRIEREAQRLDEDDLPDSVKEFLAERKE